MKKILSLAFCLSIYFLTGQKAYSQENAQWAFYLAFEDAIGARDTVWLVLDDAAGPSTMDVQFGEEPIVLNDTTFNVWTYTLDWNEPYNCYATNFGNAGLYIEGNNYSLPITLTWDSTLFQADILYDKLGYGANWAVLESQYFGAIWSETGYIMLESETIEMPFFSWGSGDHFPLEFRIQFGLGDPLSSKELEKQKLNLFPNPIQDKLNFLTDSQLKYFEVYSIGGELVYSQSLFNNQSELYSFDVSKLSSGMYVVVSKFEQGVLTGKFVKD